MFYQINNYLQCIIIFILSFFLSCIFTKLLIYIQNKNKVYIYQREEVDKLHYSKEHTPSMGGISIFFSSFISLLLVNYKFIYDKKILAIIITFFAFFINGLLDDLLKVIYKNYKGMSGYIRLFFEILFSMILLFVLGYSFKDFQYVNFFNVKLYLGLFAVFIACFIMVGSSNAMNLSDGLDGLATILYIISLMPFIIYAFKNNDLYIGLYLLATFSSCIGFIIFNMKPAKIFMGDCGSLYLGSILGGVSIYFHLEYILLICGIVLIVETLSVIIQVIYYKLTKKRIFLMAPLHHHFEMKGLSEEFVVLLFMVRIYIFFYKRIINYMKVLIIGYGKTGKSLKKYFDKYQNEVFIYDKNTINEKNYCSYNYLKDKLPLFDLGIKSPGISDIDEEYLLIKSLCKEIYSDLDYAFMKLNKCHVIGITGSNGKTSFATYLYHFLSMKYRTFLAGNIGKPLIDYVDEIIDNDYVILELSSFQIRDSKLIKLDTLFYTSLSPNHLNVYIDVNHYYADKKRALFFIKNNEIYFINNLDNVIGIKDNQFEIKINFINEIKKYLQGEYSCKYANIAMNYCLNKGFSKEELLNRLITLKPVKYRLNKVFENKQFIFIND